MQIFLALFTLAAYWNQDEHENNGKAFTQWVFRSHHYASWVHKQYNSSDQFYYHVVNYNYILIYYKHCNSHGLPLPVTNYAGNMLEH